MTRFEYGVPIVEDVPVMAAKQHTAKETSTSAAVCLTHGDGCAFPGEHPELCPYCHASWEKITAPATHETTRRYTNSKGAPVVSTITRHLSGYGETKEDHLARHAASEAKRAEATAKEKKKKKATADAL